MWPYERVPDKNGAWYLPLRVQDIINHGFKYLLQVSYGRLITIITALYPMAIRRKGLWNSSIIKNILFHNGLLIPGVRDLG